MLPEAVGGATVFFILKASNITVVNYCLLAESTLVG
jgi:hypothetical protein